MKELIKKYDGKNIHIVGIAGAEGSAIAEFLAINGIDDLTGHDFSDRENFGKSFNSTHLSLKPKERGIALDHLLKLPIKINYEENYLSCVENADIVFVSQVWFKYPQNLPKLKDLYDRGIPFKTITNLYFEIAPCKIISVTGTNGKTTTSRLINSIFEVWTEKENQAKIYFAGNDRQNIQVLDKLEKMKPEDVLILETSSTQLLLNSKISPHIGVITNITPNHIDDHGSFENYIEAKKNILRWQKKGDYGVLNFDNNVTKKIAEGFKDRAFMFSRLEKLDEGCFLSGDSIVARKNGKETVLLKVSDIKIPGAHNVENVLAAASAAYLFGIDPEIIKEGVSGYAGIKHRLKLLYNIEGIKYYDDTQATTPEATISGLDSFNNDIILFAGGDDKGMRYENLAEKINEKVKFMILLPGDASEKIADLVDKRKFVRVADMDKALGELKKYFQKTAPKQGSVVLISPASAHFYSKFVESTGKDLKEWIRSISSI